MADVNLVISVTKLNMTGLNIPIKGQIMSGWIKKQNKIQLYAFYKRHTLDLKTQID